MKIVLLLVMCIIISVIMWGIHLHYGSRETIIEVDDTDDWFFPDMKDAECLQGGERTTVTPNKYATYLTDRIYDHLTNEPKQYGIDCAVTNKFEYFLDFKHIEVYTNHSKN